MRIETPMDGLDRLIAALTVADLAAVRTSVECGTPLGDAADRLHSRQLWPTLA